MSLTTTLLDPISLFEAVPALDARGDLSPEGFLVTNAASNDIEQTRLTQATYDRLVAELEDLTTRGRVEIAELIEAARALGDLKENGDYHAAKDSQGKMESRIRQLQEERQGDLPVLSPSAPLGQVVMGKNAGDTVEYTAPGGMLRVEIVSVTR
jgi:transcription elongation factor GreA